MGGKWKRQGGGGSETFLSKNCLKISSLMGSFCACQNCKCCNIASGLKPVYFSSCKQPFTQFCLLASLAWPVS